MSEVEINTLLSRQKKIAEQFEKLLKNTKKDSKDRTDFNYINKRFIEANTLWSEFYDNNNKLFPYKDTSPHSAQPYFKNNSYYNTNLIFQELSTVLGARLTTYLEKKGETQNKTDEMSPPQGNPEDRAKMAAKKRARKEANLAINEINLTSMFTDIEEMEVVIESLGTLEMKAEELKKIIQ